ncbi:MAG: hypothetical protein LKI24_01580 [Acidipropionibacterium sp.]|jgi:hypothetical protein|nr:hypothetical protein [Acidipropionibacterium sp.]
MSSSADPLPSGLESVLESAARLQELVPDAVMVGGSAAAYYAHHQRSLDHDHVLDDLRDRFDIVLDALERDGEFVLNRAVPGKIILGELGGTEVGVRQLIRERPLEVQQVALPSGATIRVPTLEEISRIKAYLIVKRNQMRDYLDLAALSGQFGADRIGTALAGIDDWYRDSSHPDDRPVQSQLARQLANPGPRDHSRVGTLSRYKGLESRWHTWDAVVTECRRLVPYIS